MLKHYIKFAFRNFKSNKVIFVGSLATLCLGALCISLLFAYVHNELTMDDFHKDKENMYMLTMKKSPEAEWSSPWVFKAEEYPEVENVSTIIPFMEDETKLKYKDYTYTPTGMVVDSSFFKVFDFELNIGDKNNILKDTEAIILSESYSKKIFGDKNPIGKKVYYEVRMHQGNYVVKGIVKIPTNSSLKFDYLIPKEDKHYGKMEMFFLRLNNGVDKKIFDQKIEKSNNNLPNWRPILKESFTKKVNFKELYFSNDYSSIKKNSLFNTGNKNNTDILQIIILVILLISILNYSNLQIVNTNSIIKNIAISKVNGASKKQIFYQKLIENIIMVGLASIIITIAYTIILPYFNDFVKVDLAPPIWRVILINTIVLLTIVSVGLIYPIVKINRFSTIKSIKLNTQKDNQLKGKNIIVIVQYALAFVLLISAIIVDKQLKLMLNKDLGFDSENILRVKLLYEPPYNAESRNWTKERRKEERKKIRKLPKYINNKLSSFSFIEKVTQGNAPMEAYTFEWKCKKGKSTYESINTLTGFTDYKHVLGLKLLEGRFFDKTRDKQRGKNIVINEAAMKHWGVIDINNTTILNQSWRGNYKIIGVVKDFNNEHLSTKPKPLVMLYWEDPEADYFIKFHKNSLKEGIKEIEALFKEINPNQTFKYSFLSDDIATLYQKEKRLSTIYIVFTIIALLISTIGLFTIALYDTQRRIKEIGVRKVNGATIKKIMLMLNKDFIKWVFVAFIIACPIAYYAMNKWLENFAYKTTLSWWIFALAGLFTLCIALLTVSWQSYKAATRNPVESLRDE